LSFEDPLLSVLPTELSTVPPLVSGGGDDCVVLVSPPLSVGELLTVSGDNSLLPVIQSPLSIGAPLLPI
jgi:hypothetical protein